LPCGLRCLLPLGVSAILVPFRSSFPNTDAALVLVAVVVAVAANGHRLTGLLAAVSAAAWFDFFLTKPYEHFSIAHRADIETTVLLLVVGAAVTEIAVWGPATSRYRGGRRGVPGRDPADHRSRRGSRALARGHRARDGAGAGVARLAGVADFERYSFGGLPRLEPDGQLRMDEAKWDVSRTGWPNLHVEVLASNQSGTYGRFVLEPVPGASASLGARRWSASWSRRSGWRWPARPGWPADVNGYLVFLGAVVVTSGIVTVAARFAARWLPERRRIR